MSKTFARLSIMIPVAIGFVSCQKHSFTLYNLKPNMARNQRTSALLLTKSGLGGFNSSLAGSTRKGHRNCRGLARLHGIQISSVGTGRSWELEPKLT